MIRYQQSSIAWQRIAHGANEKVEPVPIDTLYIIRTGLLDDFTHTTSSAFGRENHTFWGFASGM